MEKVQATEMIIAIAGGTGSGKTTAARYITNKLGEAAEIISFDDYYRDQAEKPMEERIKTNYDHPEALEADLLGKHLEALKQGKTIERPVYNFSIHTRSAQTIRTEPKKYVVVEGILILAYEELRRWFDIKLFMDEPADIRFIRRLTRDTQERGRSMESVVEQYMTSVRPMHDTFVEPTKQWADEVVKGEANDQRLDQVMERYLGI